MTVPAIINGGAGVITGPSTPPEINQEIVGDGSRGLKIRVPRRYQFVHRQVVSKGDINVQGQSNGTDLAATFSAKYTMATDIVGCRVVFQNFKNAGLSGDNAYTIGNCAWDSNNGVNQRTPITFNGSTTVTIQPGGTVISDPIGCMLPAGTLFSVYTYVSVASNGQKLPYAYLHLSGVDGNNLVSRGGAGTDVVYSATPTAVPSNTPGFGPTAIIGMCDRWQPVLCGVGDSKMLGANEASATQIMGYFYRAALASGLPFLRIAQSGQTMQNWANALLQRNPMTILPMAGVSDFYINFGVNDIYLNSRTLSQLQADAIVVWSNYARLGARNWQITCEHRTTSTDSYATLNNQTNSTGFGPGSTCDDWNLWLLDGAPIIAGVAATTGTTNASAIRAGNVLHPLSGVVDILPAVQTGYKWLVDGTANKYTTDGIHEQTFAHQQVQPILQNHMAALASV